MRRLNVELGLRPTAHKPRHHHTHHSGDHSGDHIGGGYGGEEEAEAPGYEPADYYREPGLSSTQEFRTRPFQPRFTSFLRCVNAVSRDCNADSPT